MLRDLVNIDKHRGLVVATYLMDDFIVASSELYEVVSAEAVRENGMEVGTVVARAHVRVADQAVDRDYLDVEIAPQHGESIEVPGIAEPVDLIVATDRVVGRIGMHLDHLESAGC